MTNPSKDYGWARLKREGDRMIEDYDYEYEWGLLRQSKFYTPIIDALRVCVVLPVVALYKIKDLINIKKID